MKGKQIILIAFLAITVAVVVFTVRQGGLSKKEVAVGLNAPDFSVVDVRTGKTLSSSELRGKVLFVHFWASWCEVCKEEMPTVNALAADMAASGDFMMITVLYQDSPENAFAYLNGKGYNLPVTADRDGTAAKNFGITGVPETYVIDRKGVLRQKVIGGADWGAPEQRRLIDSLLKG